MSIDDRALGGEQVSGRVEALAYLRAAMNQRSAGGLRQPGYVSATGLLVPAWSVPKSGYGPEDVALLMTVGDAGLVSAETAVSVVTGRGRAPGQDWERLEQLAREYVAARNRDDPGSVRLDRIPAFGGPAVLAVTDLAAGGPVRRVVLLLTSRARCPGHRAVVLTLDADGSVVSEKTYQRLDDAPRCLGEVARRGWWTGLEVPDPVPNKRTGTVTAGSAAVEIWNGTPELEQLVTWALGRFVAAGLAPPAPSSVTFEAASKGPCRGASGLAEGEAFTEITLCLGVEDVCPPGGCPPFTLRARRLALHELSHTWLATHVSPREREEYARAVGLRWSAPQDPAERQAVERAAETVAWGLLGEPVPVPPLRGVDDATRAAEFRFLTGAEPLAGP